MTQQFNLDEALELVKQGGRIDGKDGVLLPLSNNLLKLYCKQNLNRILILR